MMPEIKLNVSKRYVQHCKAETNYEIITHEFDPVGCEFCEEIRRLIEMHVESHWKGVTNE